MAGENRGPELLAIIWPFTIIAILTVTLKLVTRTHIIHALGWDDFFVLLSLVLIVVCTSIFTYDVHLGMGRHASELSLEQLSYAVKVNLIGNPFGIMAYSFPNISIAILLDRLLVGDKLRSIALHTLAGLQSAIAAVSCILLFVQCTPTEYLWNPTIPATCFPAGTVSRYSYFVGSFTAFTDIVLGIVPIAAFWNLQLPTKTKVSLCFLMGCTLFAAICSIVKTTKLDELADLQDFTYDTVDLIIWAIVEANVIIIAASVSSLGPFFRTALQKGSGTEGRSLSPGQGTSFSFGIPSNKSLVRPKQSRVSSRSRESESQDDVELGAQNTPLRRGDSNNTIWRTTEIKVTATNGSQ